MSKLQTAPAWMPSAADIENANVTAMMRDLGLTTYEELHAWSVENRAAYWERVTRQLGIVFRKPYTEMLDVSGGVEDARWLVGASLNIVETCFNAPAEASPSPTRAKTGWFAQ